MFITNTLFKKVKSKQVLALVRSTVSGHILIMRRERVAEKIECIKWDPYGPVTGNLTGSPRVLNDAVVTIHSTIQSWKVLLVNGINVIKSIQSISGVSRDEVDVKCQEIGDIARKMKDLVNTLKKYATRLASLSLLNSDARPPFLTWTYEHFASFAEDVWKIFNQETEVRLNIIKFLHHSEEQTLNIIAVIWTHLVHADDLFDMKFEAMLVEARLVN